MTFLSFEWKSRRVIDRSAGWKWWFVIGSGGKEKCGLQVAGHSKDVVQWWIWLGWRTWDEKLRRSRRVRQKDFRAKQVG